MSHRCELVLAPKRQRKSVLLQPKAGIHEVQISFMEMIEAAEDKSRQAPGKGRGGFHIESSIVKAVGLTGKI